MKMSILAVLLIMINISSYADDEQTDKIRLPETVQEFLKKNKKLFKDFKLSDLTNLKRYKSHIRYYEVPASIEEVWRAYLNVDQSKAWSGKIASFGLIHSTAEDRTFYIGEELPKVAVGQIFMLNLKFLGFYNIPVAFQITGISADEDDDRELEFTYLKANVSNGNQTISFGTMADDEGNESTLIKHTSYFASGKDFRDKIYPTFHEQAIDEFHTNVLATIGHELQVLKPRKLSNYFY